MSVPGATIRAMQGDLERLPAAASGAGPAALAAELLGRVRAELPVIGELGEREQVLVSAWLTGLRSARTRRAYAADVAAWLVDSGPAVAGGTVYVVGSKDGRVYALDAATGRLRWSYTTGGFTVSGPAVAGGTVYVGSNDHKVYALSAGS